MLASSAVSIRRCATASASSPSSRQRSASSTDCFWLMEMRRLSTTITRPSKSSANIAALWQLLLRALDMGM